MNIMYKTPAVTKKMAVMTTENVFVMKYKNKCKINST
jgi:hypothetical protein